MSPVIEEKLAVLAELESVGPTWWFPSVDQERYDEDHWYADEIDHLLKQVENDAALVLSWLGDLEEHEVG